MSCGRIMERAPALDSPLRRDTGRPAGRPPRIRSTAGGGGKDTGRHREAYTNGSEGERARDSCRSLSPTPTTHTNPIGYRSGRERGEKNENSFTFSHVTFHLTVTVSLSSLSPKSPNSAAPLLSVPPLCSISPGCSADLPFLGQTIYPPPPPALLKIVAHTFSPHS